MILLLVCYITTNPLNANLICRDGPKSGDFLDGSGAQLGQILCSQVNCSGGRYPKFDTKYKY